MKLRKNQLIFFYLCHAFLILFILFPILWALSTSLKSAVEMSVYPPTLLPQNPTWEAYQRILTDRNAGGDLWFLRMFTNSGVTTLATACLVSILSTMAGYGLTFFHFKGKEFIFFLFILTMFVPFQSLLIPLYTQIAGMGLNNTFTGLVLIYTTLQLPFGIFMMRNSFSALPLSLRESAFIDGSSEWATLLRVILPLALPGILTTFIYSCYITWNDYLIALIFNTENSSSMLTVGLQAMTSTPYGRHWQLMMAATILSFLPIVFIYGVLQNFFIRGITGSAIKE